MLGEHRKTKKFFKKIIVDDFKVPINVRNILVNSAAGLSELLKQFSFGVFYTRDHFGQIPY